MGLLVACSSISRQNKQNRRPAFDIRRSSCDLFLSFTSEQARIKSNFLGFSLIPVSPDWGQSGTIVLPVDILGMVLVVHRPEKRPFCDAVSKVIRRTENEWENVKAPGRSG
jgi:hypothetical protein